MLCVLLRSRSEIVTRNSSRARVPSQDCIVVSRWTNRFSLLEPFHRLAKPIVSRVVRAGRAFRQPRFSSTLPNYSRVICALVFVRDPREHLLNLSVAD